MNAVPALCHRCQRELPVLAGDGGAPETRDNVLLFCPHCAAPQIRLPEYSQTPDAAAASTGALPPPVPGDSQNRNPDRRMDTGAFAQSPAHVNWRAALRVCALVAGLSAAANLFSLAANEAVGNVAAFFAQLLDVGGAALAVGLYAQLAPRNHLTFRRGLSIGTVTGLLTVAATSVAYAIAGVAARFLLRSADFNTAVESRFADFSKSMIIAFDGQPNSADFLKGLSAHLAVPEFRAALVLSKLAFFAGMLIMIAALSGAAAGLLRAPRRRSSS